MSKKKRESRSWHEYMLMAVIAVAVIGTGGIAYIVGEGLNRVTTLQDLQTEAETSYRRVLELSNETYEVMYAKNDLASSQEPWERLYVAVSREIVDLSSHPATELVDEDTRALVQDSREYWLVATTGFLSANSQLRDAVQDNRAFVVQRNVAQTIAALEELDTPIAQEELEKWTGILEEIQVTNRKIRNFTISTLNRIVTRVEIETTRRIDETTRLAGIISSVIAFIVLASLLAAVRLLHTANKRIAERSRSVQALLDASDEGFFSYKKDLIVQPETSRECASIFDREIAGERVEEMLFNGDAERRESFQQAMEMVFEKPASAEVVFGALKNKVQINDKTVEVLYRQIDSETLMGVLKDITEAEEEKKQREQERENEEMVLRVVTSRAHFLSAVDEAEPLFEEIIGVDKEGAANIEELTRRLHTFKSNVAFLKMRKTAKLVHELETALVDSQMFEDTAPVRPLAEETKTTFQEEIEYVKNTLGETWIRERHTQEVDGRLLQELYEESKEKYGADKDYIRKVEKVAQIPLSKLADQVKELAPTIGETRGKRVEVVADTGSTSVSPTVYRELSNAMNHLVRNIVDHGIEFPRQRERSGKNAAGVINIKAAKGPEGLEIVVGDDGGGIDPEKVKAKAIERGLIQEEQELTKEEIARLIFTDGFSTADAVSAISGRGVGLAAVREGIHKIGGNIGVTTTKDRGTKFKIIIKEKARIK